MSRAQRLLALLQLLRAHRFPVSGAKLAAELGVSLRTLYRDVATLQAQGADIQGEPGLGYVLRPGFMLPPLMFSVDELEALMLGTRWVARRTDDPLGEAARTAIHKIAAVLPQDLREELDASALLVGTGQVTPVQVDLVEVRRAIREERKLAIRYLDLQERESSRVLWPFALAFFDQVRMLVAWCEERQAFRHFRADRIRSLAVLDEGYPRRRQVLLHEWRAQEGIPSQDATADKN